MSEINHEENKELEEALHYIEAVKGECAVFGFNDSEWAQFEDIKKRLLAGKINSEQAKKEADTVLNSKSDYH